MTHFAEEDWADFARVETGAEQAARMQRHLDEGCAECRRAHDLWASVGRVAGHEADYQPPESAVRQVKGQYTLRKADGVLSRLRSAVLVFDSARLPAAAGVRAAAATSARQLLYRFGNRLVKLRLETTEEPARLSLVGQI